jgi:uncharacterized membrane protein
MSNDLLRAAALGAATGGRSSAGPLAAALSSRPWDGCGVARRLGSRTGRVVTVLMAAGELVVDKLPATPSRTAGMVLAPRVLLGAAAPAAVAGREGRRLAVPALVGAAAAVGASLLGVRWRAAAARRFGSDLPGALVEDAVTAGLGYLGARRRPA